MKARLVANAPARNASRLTVIVLVLQIAEVEMERAAVPGVNFP
jgi:hypothetical protein